MNASECSVFSVVTRDSQRSTRPGLPPRVVCCRKWNLIWTGWYKSSSKIGKEIPAAMRLSSRQKALCGREEPSKNLARPTRTGTKRKQISARPSQTNFINELELKL